MTHRASLLTLQGNLREVPRKRPLRDHHASMCVSPGILTPTAILQMRKLREQKGGREGVKVMSQTGL